MASPCEVPVSGGSTASIMIYEVKRYSGYGCDFYKFSEVLATEKVR